MFMIKMLNKAYGSLFPVVGHLIAQGNDLCTLFAVKLNNNRDIEPWLICRSNLSRSAHRHWPELRQSLGVQDDRCMTFGYMWNDLTTGSPEDLKKNWTVCRSNLSKSY